MTRIPSLAIAGLAGLLLLGSLAGCANSQSGSSYGRSSTRQEMTVRQGVVESVRKVTIEGGNTPVGTVAGAAIGGMAGSNVGSGRGSTVGAILGAVAGGMAGSALEEKISKRDGVEITVKLDNGNLVAIVQEADEEFHPGERVRILSGNGSSRVSH